MRFDIEFQSYIRSLSKKEIKNALKIREEINTCNFLRSTYHQSVHQKEDLVHDLFLGILSGSIEQDKIPLQIRENFRHLPTDQLCKLVYDGYYCPIRKDSGFNWQYYLKNKGDNSQIRSIIYEKDKKFDKDIKDKHVLVIGPGATLDYDLYHFIDINKISHLFVIAQPRLLENFVQSMHKSNTNIYKHLCLNGEISKKYFYQLKNNTQYEGHRNYFLGIEKFDSIIFKSQNLMSTFGVNSRLMRIPRYYPYKSLGVSTHFFGNVLFDILAAKPASIDILGVDLFTGNTKYINPHNYRETRAPAIPKLLQGKHEPISAFRFIKTLIKNSKTAIRLSKSLNKIIEMSEFEYLSLLAK